MTKEYIVKITDNVIPDAFARFEDEHSPEQELVRCKYCENRECFDRFGHAVCEITGEHHDRDWFCADGERQ